ncbi:MAG: hypothetical protein ABFC96_04295 [Thermoguttaceae bacterium]
MKSNRRLCIALSLIAITHTAAYSQTTTAVPVEAIGHTCRLIGHTGQPLGVMTTLSGVVVDGDRCKGDLIGPILQIQRINGQATQECLEIEVRPFRSGFGKPYFVANLDETSSRPDPKRSLPRLKNGSTYEFWGYETGAFVGEPNEAGWDGGVFRQSAGFRFHTAFVVVQGKRIRPIALSPRDFAGREALVHGKAENRGGKPWLTNPDWQIEVLQNHAWPDTVADAWVGVAGMIQTASGAKTLQIRPSHVQPDSLEQQVGRRVELRGEARQRNGRWFLRCNGHDLRMRQIDRLLAVFDSCTPMCVTGSLRRERLRDSDAGPGNGPEEPYVLSDISCRLVKDLLPIERIAEPCPWSIGLGVTHEHDSVWKKK